MQTQTRIIGIFFGSFFGPRRETGRQTTETWIASNGSTVDNRVTFTYDSVGNRLTAADFDGAYTFTYDANGNRNNGSYSTGTGNRLTSDGTWTYTYDDEGNLTKKSKGAAAETWTYGYDQTNHLISVKHSATDGGAIDKQVDFKYDAWGNRLEKSYDADGAGSGSAVVTKFAVDGWNPAKPTPVGKENFDVWADLDGSGSLTTRYLRGDAVDQVFARIANSTGYYFLNDHLGSIREVAQASSGNIVDTVTYDGFGNITSETDSTKRGRYAWTGRELDTEINLQYNRARYYDATIGRWISQDPLGFDAGDGNLFRYVGNSPTNDTDPSGLDYIAIGSMPIAQTGGVAGHLTIEYWKCNEENGNDELVGKTISISSIKGSTRTESVELDQRAWKAIGYNSAFINKGYHYYDVNISFIKYNSPNTDRLVPVLVEKDAKKLKEKWDTIIQYAQKYEYAEQPGWDKDAKGAFITKWTNSHYKINLGVAASATNNSNTFVRFIASASALPYQEPAGRTYPGRQSPQPIVYGPNDITFSPNWKPFDPLLEKNEWPAFPLQPPR